jgi:ATP-dependent RNA helicase
MEKKYSPKKSSKKSRKVNIYPTFEKMNLKENLLAGIYEAGFNKPSAIQQRAIIPIVRGKSLLQKYL